MSDLPRLRDEGSAFERGLLASARRDRMSPEARRALVAAVATVATAGAGVVAEPSSAAAASAGGAGAAGASKASALAIVKWAVLGALASGVVAVGAVATSRMVAAPRPTPAPVSAPAPSATEPAASVAPSPAPLPSEANVETDVGPALASSPRHRRPPHRAAPRDGNDETSLGLELKLIERARAALAAGHASEALAALDEHRTRFAKGALSEEASVLRIEALVREGETKTASTLAKGFLASRPRSPYADRVLRALRAIEGEAK